MDAVTRISKLILVFSLAASPAWAQTAPPAGSFCPSSLSKDWKKAVWRVPFHIALSVPVAASALVIPPLGTKYIRWRIKAESQDIAQHADTCMKGTIDLYSQTALVRGALRIYGIKTP